MRKPVAVVLGCLAGAMAAAWIAPARTAGNASFWVVGSFVKGCWIVEQNPLIDGGTIQFSDGPYRSRDDAELARSTIRACKT
ncbi:hypothetical protein JQ557_20025 [Bradyrhizobium sp. U87765 SZCCT0131]|nr:hypothetical protein [Bradyrhizobium sp. U87765 SZCCT0131]MBR1263245.1 hypothetical protein [Bradyrhizobium sp. U87765 SZCCT0134]MBR1306872.1 hypothetical protein [Bradyrhizobium sp. U87765 SZCCT0110]MBR1323371.1 hypothetical protein [Bradyrhizobium sp. U87765 SZCCT0109]MBR1345826.1 hypothetical protein [Bradyrhizobium sp. U87765 SZCCT0048]